MGYKLADGSLSTDYEVGDTFEVVLTIPTAKKGSFVKLEHDDGSSCPFFTGGGLFIRPSVVWHGLKATPETKRKRFKFTKSDLKDGMRCTDRDGDVWYVCGGSMVLLEYCSVQPISGWHENLKDKGGNGELGYDLEVNDIMKVTDRDGTVLFEREEDPRELTIEEIAEAFNLPVERVRIKK